MGCSICAAYVLDLPQHAYDVLQIQHGCVEHMGSSALLCLDSLRAVASRHVGASFLFACSVLPTGADPCQDERNLRVFLRVFGWLKEVLQGRLFALVPSCAENIASAQACRALFQADVVRFPEDACCVGRLAGLQWWCHSPTCDLLPLSRVLPPDLPSILLPGWRTTVEARCLALLCEYPSQSCCSASGAHRCLVPLEMERIVGFPDHYTAPLLRTLEDEPLHLLAQRRAQLLQDVLPLQLAEALLRAVGVVSSQPCSPHEADTGELDHNFRALTEYADTYKELRRQCPYIQDLCDRGMPTDEPMGPGPIEQNSSSSASVALLVQHRSQTSAAGHSSLLPLGLDPVSRFQCGEVVESPLSLEPPVPDDLDFALRKCLALGKKARAWRRAQFSRLRSICESAEGMADSLNCARSSTSHKVSEHVHLDRLELSRYSICWPDIFLLELAQKGALIVGELPRSNIYRAASVEPTVPLQDFENGHDDYVQKLVSRRPPPPEQVRVVWEKSEVERKSGTLRGYWTAAEMDARHGKGRWRPMPRFAVWQQAHSKWRLIDNAKESDTNSTLQAWERIHTTSSSASFAAVRRLRNLHGAALDGGWEVRVSTHDLEKAYRQVPVNPQHLRYSIVAIFHPERQQWVFAECDGLAFGLGAAVLGFNRIPTFVVALARRWLAIPVFAFFDDFKVIDVACSGGSATRSFLELLSWLGYKRDPAKDQMPTADAIFLGARELYTELGSHERIRHLPKPGREEQIKNMILQIFHDNRLHRSVASSLRGKLLHLAETYQGRSGRVPVPYLDERTTSDDTALGHGLRLELCLFLELLHSCPYREIPLMPGAYRKVALFTDASFKLDLQGRPAARVCFIVACLKEHLRRGAVIDIPLYVLEQFQSSETLIAQAEALAPMLALYFERELLQHCLLTVFIDNMAVLCSYVLGTSRSLDLGSIVHATVLRLMRQGVRAWWEHVPSKSNIADGGSREGVSCPEAAKAGIQLCQLRFPLSWPKNHLQLSMAEWNEFWS